VKQLFTILFILSLVLGSSLQGQAELILRGTDSLGNRLIYDSDLNITWYDYKKSRGTWQEQVSWASGLIVNFNGTIFDDWGLPTTVDGPYIFGYDGSTTAGFNITSSEMGHLYYIELDNKGYVATDGTRPQLGWGLTNTGDFLNLVDQPDEYYWSGTEYAAYPERAWSFSFGVGRQVPANEGTYFYAIAVRDGDVINDSDGDSILNEFDNCRLVTNLLQEDTDQDLIGDACDPDDDNDSILDSSDNCQLTANPSQDDNDNDNVGDICDPDDDNDDIVDVADNCPFTANLNQSDIDADGLGDICDIDPDGDNLIADDNCPMIPNPLQEDNDGDSEGDACDPDDDNDGMLDINDNCPTVANILQEDFDQDNIGDACDIDLDNDGVENDIDNCPWVFNIGQEDTDGQGDGDACDIDDDNDGILDEADNCQFIYNPYQNDSDGDGKGNVCDEDWDGDGVANEIDNCEYLPNSNQYDWDNDGEGDVCDTDVDGDGVLNGSDLCAFTPIGAVVDPSNGGSIEQLNPCEGPRGTTVSWRNHGKYVSSTAKTANSFLEQGLITEEEKDMIVSSAANSTCGHKE
jgi:hypothetical protein